LLDFCFDYDVLELYKRLCRYYLAIDPAAMASYVRAYRELWEEETERSGEWDKLSPKKK